jgi:undecaprenyl-diphosphatase
MPSLRPVRPSARGPWLLAAVAVLVVLALALLVTTGITDPFDRAVTDLVRSPEARDTLAPLRQVTELGAAWTVTTVAVILLVGGSTAGRPRDAVAGAATIALGAAIIEIVKRVIARTRPEILEPILIETGFSFPSGHSANAMVAYGIVAVVVGRTTVGRWARLAIQALLGTVIVLVGISRVWLGVHFPTDVIAGWALGAVAVCAYAALTRPASPAPGAEAAAADPAAPRSDPPAVG